MNSPRTFAFGPFVLFPERQLLLRGETPVRLGGRALDLLTALAERPGELVTKAELMAKVWPHTVVVEANLKVNMRALRQALDDVSETSKYIATVTGRGYRFVAPVPQIGPPAHDLGSQSPLHQKTNLPTASTRIFGRAETIASIHKDLTETRLVSIIGAGGMGKTTVALAIAEQSLGQFQDGVWLVDLATSREPGLTANTIATAVGVTNHSSNVLEFLCEFLRDRCLLIVLDNCEHLIDSVAVCASQILSSAPGVKLLATSREPLSVKGERVRRLLALGTPPSNLETSAKDSLEFPAVQLFVERATEKLETFVLTDANAALVGEICRRLDGLALAIALAATRVDAFGVKGLLDQLDNRLGLLKGLRSSPERQRTLTATLDWSYGLLNREEATLLRAVSVFAGWFDVEDATALAGGNCGDAATALAQLAAKSLLDIDIDINTDKVAYRFLETTRVYCLEHLRGDEIEERAVRHRHANRVCEVLQRARSDKTSMTGPEWGGRYGRVLADLRWALASAKLDAADREMSVRLTVSGLVLWEYFSLTDESRVHTAAAIEDLDAAGLVGTAYEMQLRLGLGASSMYSQGQKTGAKEAMQRALVIAEKLGDTDYQLRCLMAISVYQIWSGDIRSGRLSLDAFASIASAKDPAMLVASEIHHGVGELISGDLEDARRRFEAVRQRGFKNTSASSLSYLLDPYAVAGGILPQAQSARGNSKQGVIQQRELQSADDSGPGYILDPYALASGILCQVHWLMGLPEAALRSAAYCRGAGQRGGGQQLTINNALSITCPVYYWSGQYEESERCVTLLEENFRAQHRTTRRPFTSFYRAALSFSKNGASSETIDDLQSAVDDFRRSNHLVRLPYYMSVLADALTQCERLDEAHATIRYALDVAHAQKEGWCLAEVLRVQATVLSAGGEKSEAEQVLALSIAESHKFGSLSWELRAATDLARLRDARGDSAGARELLHSTLNLFTEGFETRDLKVATSLVATLDPVGSACYSVEAKYSASGPVDGRTTRSAY